MNRMLQCDGWRRRGLATAMAASALIWSSISVPAAAAELKVGDKLPSLTLKDLNGKAVNTASFKNKVMWLAFFHST